MSKLSEAEENALLYAGLMGHEFVVLEPKGEGFRISSQCPTLKSAKRDIPAKGIIYQQLPNRKWKRLG